MSTPAQMQRWKETSGFRMNRKQGRDYDINTSSGFLWGQASREIRDFRDELNKFEETEVKALFGTSNNLFEDEAGTPPHNSEESCQYSSAVWCRTAMAKLGKKWDDPDTDVHRYKKAEIALLFNQCRPGDWWWNGDCEDPKTSYVGDQTYHDRIVAQLKILLNPRGLPLQVWPRINVSPMYPHNADTIIRDALAIRKKATLIQMKKHVFAIFYKDRNEIYAFDTTIGCLKFMDKQLLRKFVLWAATCNFELTNGDAGTYPPWTAVACGR